MYPIKFLIAYNISGIWYEQINMYNVDLNTINLTMDWRFRAVPNKRTQAIIL